MAALCHVPAPPPGFAGTARYAMWFDASAPHRLVRFEGPYGPPGAPEILLELAALDRALVRSSSREPSVMDHAARVQLIA